MATETTERKATNSTHIGAPPPEPEHLPCPRCDSTNTKFCYYNNYNFSQPRHFCKSCRRYWTHGGTLRDIPVGGGTRKNAKRSRASVAADSATSSVASGRHSVFALPHHDFRQVSTAGSQLLVPIAGDHHGGSLPFVVNEGKMGGSFTSLLTTQGAGLFSLGGFGPGIDDLGFGLGRAVWPFHGVVEGGPTNGNGSSVAGNTWLLDNGQGGFVGGGGGDCFNLPDIAISTPGSMLK